jgi:hypothetical protein
MAAAARPHPLRPAADEPDALVAAGELRAAMEDRSSASRLVGGVDTLPWKSALSSGPGTVGAGIDVPPRRPGSQLGRPSFTGGGF